MSKHGSVIGDLRARANVCEEQAKRYMLEIDEALLAVHAKQDAVRELSTKALDLRLAADELARAGAERCEQTGSRLGGPAPVGPGGGGPGNDPAKGPGNDPKAGPESGWPKL